MNQSENFRSVLTVSQTQATAFRLSRHHLLQRAPRKSLPTVVRDMGGAQAQLLPAAQLSLRARIDDLRHEDVDAAMRKRRLVKASCMRNTLFLVPSKDLAIFALGAARRGEGEIRWAQKKGLPLRAIEVVIEAALNVLEEPLTRPEIAERVTAILGVKKQAVHGGGWGRRGKIAAVPVGKLVYPVVDLLHLAAARGVICYGPARGNEPTFVRADAWLPDWWDFPREQAEESLLSIYLKAFGPAAPEDFALWSGFTLTGAREIWSRMRDALMPVSMEGREAMALQEDLDDLANAAFQRPSVRLLPHFDTFLLGHKERDHLLAMERRLHVYRPQGWIAPVVLVNGRVAGLWERAREGDRLRVSVTKFEPISRRVISAIREEAEDIGRFLGVPDVDLVTA